MRKLELEDAFIFSEIVDKMGISTELEKLITEVKSAPQGSYTQETAGVKVVVMLFSKMHKAKKEMIAFASSMLGKKPEETAKLNFTELKQVFTELVSSEEFAPFFNSAAEEPK
jgi:hypothetical protein